MCLYQGPNFVQLSLVQAIVPRQLDPRLKPELGFLLFHISPDQDGRQINFCLSHRLP